MLPVAEAQARILAALRPVGVERVALTAALGRTLAEDVVARVTQPPADVSAMDGYAVRAADLVEAPVRLRVVGAVPAGRSLDREIGPGEAARIFTGAPLPPGADSIVIQENTAAEGDDVLVQKPARLGQFVRRAGLDFRAGDVGLAAGRRLTVRDIGLAAAMDHPWLPVRRRPRIAILSTGDEIVFPGEPRGPNQIVSSNGFALAAFVAAWGGEPIHIGIAPDRPEALQRTAAAAEGADLLVTSGGASVGEHDLVRTALAEGGLALDFWKIAMRPGKPLMFGRMGRTPVLGVPGNPVSSLVCAVVFLQPALDRLLGVVADAARPQPTALLGCDLAANDERQDYLRATLAADAGGRPVATPFPLQDSAMLSRLAQADCLVVRPPHAPAARAGESVGILPLAGSAIGV